MKWSFPTEWHALGREADLAAEQLATGATLLRRANHAQQGLYTQAFFGLSIGLERVAKLAIIADYAIEHKGSFPENRILKDIGHDIDVLLKHCEPLSIKWRNSKDYSERPNLEVHQGIVETLTEFAKSSRYYNLDFLTGVKKQFPEPVSAWWRRVGQPILQKHYSQRQRKKDEEQSKFIHNLLSEHTSILYHNEYENNIDSIEALMMQAKATKIDQKYGMFYTLQIVRWLAFLIADISHIGAYQYSREPLFGLDERFFIFMNTDAFLKGRKTWSIYRR